MNAGEDPSAENLQPRKPSAAWPIILAALVVVTLIIGVAGLQLFQQEETLRERLDDALSATHVNTIGVLSSWLTEEEKEARGIAEDSTINSLIRKIVSSEVGADAAARLNATNLLRDHVDASSEFVVVDLDNIVRVSSSESEIGTNVGDLSPELIGTASAPPRFQAFEPPRSSDGRGRRAHRSLDIATAVQAPDGEVEAILIVRLDPEGQFTDILQRGRIGESGETYAVNTIGDLISRSRFDGQLFAIGLVDSGEPGLLNISIRDPGGDMTQGFVPPFGRGQRPLTQMAHDVIDGNSSIDLDGYRDYRGVPVVGVWTWDSRHRIGIATEIDVEEAFVPTDQARRSTLLAVSFTVFLLGALVVLFLRNRRKVTAANFALDGALTLVNTRSEELETKNLELEGLSTKLSKYLSPQVYSSIFTGKQSVEIASKRKKLTVFFSDIVSFTETTDNMESEELTNLLNHYLTEMSTIALEHGATIDKYVGDAILAFFGDPETRGVKEDAQACVLMAIAMQRRMRELDQEWRDRGLERPFRIRVGINTGFCTVGNFGSRDRMDYTIIGNEVNLASRLESSSELGGILMAQETYALVKEIVATEEQEPITAKGFAQPVRNHKVVGAYDELVEGGQMLRREKDGVKLEVNWERQDRTEAIETIESFLSELKD